MKEVFFKTFTETQLLDMFYKFYHSKGLTSTPYKFIEELGLKTEWEQYLKLKKILENE